MTQANNNGNIEAVMAVHEQHEDDLLELYTSFINSYDGSSDAFEKSEPFMKDLFLGFQFSHRGRAEGFAVVSRLRRILRLAPRELVQGDAHRADRRGHTGRNRERRRRGGTRSHHVRWNGGRRRGWKVQDTLFRARQRRFRGRRCEKHGERWEDGPARDEFAGQHEPSKR